MVGVWSRILPFFLGFRLFQIGQYPDKPGRFLAATIQTGRIARAGLISAGRIRALRIMKKLGGQRDLVEVILTLCRSGRLAGGVHGGQQQPHQHADHRDDDQKFYEREAGMAGVGPETHRATLPKRVFTVRPRTSLLILAGVSRVYWPPGMLDPKPFGRAKLGARGVEIGTPFSRQGNFLWATFGQK
jgi:hypothetical protein